MSDDYEKISDDHEKIHENVLNSDNPDNKLEFFWLTFKDSIRNYLNDEERYELLEISKKLNDLQQEKRYEEIEEYIKSHIEKVGYGMIINDDYYKAGHLKTNIKRWKKLTGCSIYPNNNTFYCLLLIFINLSQGKYRDRCEVEEMKDCIRKYSLNTMDNTKLIKLMNLSIRHKMHSNIDKLRNILDIGAFIKDEKIKLKNNFVNTKSNKLCKYLHEL